MIKQIDKNADRKIRARRQNDIKGTASCPRLVVYRSLTNVYAQLINDEKGVTLFSVNTLQPEMKTAVKGKSKKEAAFIIGEKLGKMAVAKKITECVFDRNGYVYHGRIAQIAEGARKGGLKF